MALSLIHIQRCVFHAWDDYLNCFEGPTHKICPSKIGWKRWGKLYSPWIWRRSVQDKILLCRSNWSRRVRALFGVTSITPMYIVPFAPLLWFCPYSTCTWYVFGAFWCLRFFTPSQIHLRESRQWLLTMKRLIKRLSNSRLLDKQVLKSASNDKAEMADCCKSQITSTNICHCQFWSRQFLHNLRLRWLWQISGVGSW